MSSSAVSVSYGDSDQDFDEFSDSRTNTDLETDGTDADLDDLYTSFE